MMLTANQLILASLSPYRRKLLEDAGVHFVGLAPEVDEDLIVAPTPGELAARRARAKAEQVAASWSQAVVIGADQTLSCEGQMFRKAKTPEEAVHRLSLLAGKTHVLHSAYCLVYAEAPGVPVRLLSARTIDCPMPMRPLSPSEIKAYVATGEWQGSVGCYKAEGRGIQLFARLTADSSAIIGLPLSPLLDDLRRVGINPLMQPNPPWHLLES